MRTRFLPAIACLLFLGCGAVTPGSRYERSMKELSEAKDEEHRFYALNDAAKDSFSIGKVSDSENYAKELLALAPRYRKDWNYGNAIQDGNLVLGRIAVQVGRLDDAKKYLREAGNSPGSPQMNSFGPNMSLAKDLLEKGQQEAVLEYFEQCRRFWKMHDGSLDQWGKEVRSGKVPNFGANLSIRWRPNPSFNSDPTGTTRFYISQL